MTTKTQNHHTGATHLKLRPLLTVLITSLLLTACGNTEHTATTVREATIPVEDYTGGAASIAVMARSWLHDEAQAIGTGAINEDGVLSWTLTDPPAGVLMSVNEFFHEADIEISDSALQLAFPEYITVSSSPRITVGFVDSEWPDQLESPGATQAVPIFADRAATVEVSISNTDIDYSGKLDLRAGWNVLKVEVLSVSEDDAGTVVRARYALGRAADIRLVAVN